MSHVRLGLRSRAPDSAMGQARARSNARTRLLNASRVAVTGHRAGAFGRDLQADVRRAMCHAAPACGPWNGVLDGHGRAAAVPATDDDHVDVAPVDDACSGRTCHCRSRAHPHAARDAVRFGYPRMNATTTARGPSSACLVGLSRPRPVRGRRATDPAQLANDIGVVEAFRRPRRGGPRSRPWDIYGRPRPPPEMGTNPGPPRRPISG